MPEYIPTIGKVALEYSHETAGGATAVAAGGYTDVTINFSGKYKFATHRIGVVSRNGVVHILIDARFSHWLTDGDGKISGMVVTVQNAHSDAYTIDWRWAIFGILA